MLKYRSKDEVVNVMSAKNLLILGNGFDLWCGIKSNYKSFICSELENMCSEEELGNRRDVFEFFVEHLYELLGDFRHRDDKIVNGKIYTLNTWYLIFIYKKLLGDYSWSYIENQMLLELRGERDIKDRIIDTLLEVLKTQVYDDEDCAIPYFIKILARILVLKNDELNMQSDRLHKQYVLCEREKSYDEKHKLKIMCDDLKSSIANILLADLMEIEKRFGKYIYEQQNASYRAKAQRLISDIFQDIESDEKKEFNILSFNYTRPWINGDIANCLNKINIHGYSEANGGKVIFGIDDLEIKAYEIEYRFTKVARIARLYAATSANICRLDDVMGVCIERVYLYGHSLSKADYSYFRVLFDKYIDTNVKFIFCYSVYDGTDEETERNRTISGITLIFGLYLEDRPECKGTYQKLLLNKRIEVKCI